MGATVPIAHASINILVPTAWAPIRHADALSGVTLRRGVAMPSEVTQMPLLKDSSLGLQYDLAINSVW